MSNFGDTGSAKSTAGSATINHSAGIITTEALTTGYGSDYSFTLTNNNIIPSSVVLFSVGGGTNTIVPALVHGVVPYAGGVTFKVRNGHTASNFNGTLMISFLAV